MSIVVGRVVAVGSANQPEERSAMPAASQTSGANRVVTLTGGETCTVDAGGPDAPRYIRMLEILAHARLPVYLELDDATRNIHRLLLPGTFQVHHVALRPVDGRLEVDLRVSHARDFVSAMNPAYQQIVDDLRTAQERRIAVLVTQAPDRPEIIDVRPAIHPIPALTTEAFTPAVTGSSIAVASTAVTSAVAQQMFDLVNAQSCPTTVSAPVCVPFLYPDQGCWARSHEMCRMMIAAGVTPAKVWAYGSRIVATRNSPECQVTWTYHTAPILGDTVIDPSLFDRPATFAEWFARQIVLPPSLPDDFEFSAADVYLTARISHDHLEHKDTQYLSTNADLLLYRLQFANRCAITAPPGPPYRCP